MRPQFSPQVVHCNTTKGPFTLHLYNEWSPFGVRRLTDLVDYGFFTDAAFFRVVPNFVAQFGVASTPAVNAAWNNLGPIEDDQNLGIAWKKGMIAFAGYGERSRTTQVFIGYKDSDSLGKNPWENPLGFVYEGMDVIESLYSYGDLEVFGGRAPDSNEIAAKGNGFLAQSHPNMDYILSCQREGAPTRPPTTTRQPTQQPTRIPTNLPTAPTPAPAPTAQPESYSLECTAQSCGSFFATGAAGEGMICSCSWKCVESKNCCFRFTKVCPDMYAKGLKMQEFQKNDALKCKERSCGKVLSADPEGKEVLCSCQPNCINDDNCCSNYIDMCSAQFPEWPTEKGASRAVSVGTVNPDDPSSTLPAAAQATAAQATAAAQATTAAQAAAAQATAVAQAAAAQAAAAQATQGGSAQSPYNKPPVDPAAAAADAAAAAAYEKAVQAAMSSVLRTRKPTTRKPTSRAPTRKPTSRRPTPKPPPRPSSSPATALQPPAVVCTKLASKKRVNQRCKKENKVVKGWTAVNGKCRKFTACPGGNRHKKWYKNRNPCKRDLAKCSAREAGKN